MNNQKRARLKRAGLIDQNLLTGSSVLGQNIKDGRQRRPVAAKHRGFVSIQKANNNFGSALRAVSVAEFG